MKVSIQVLGSLGDVMPYISTAKALQATGAEVSILAPRDFTELIGAAGIAVDTPAAFSLTDWMAQAGRRGTLAGPAAFFRDWADMIQPHIDDVTDRALAAAKGADIVVANLICAPARVAAEAHGAAFMLTAQQPVLSPTRHLPCAMIWRPWMGAGFNRAGYAMVAAAQRLIGISLARHRRALGLAPRPGFSDMRTHLGRPLCKVTTLPAPLATAAPIDWGTDDVLTAYPSLQSHGGAALPPALEAFLAAGAPPVYVGLGSLGPAYGAPLAGLAQRALDAAGLRGVFPAGMSDAAEGRMGPHFVAGHVAHDALFPRCAAVVHHGGAGTTDTALRAGTPQIVQPHFLDQFWYGAQLRRIGVAGEALPARQLTSETLERALGDALRPSVAAAVQRAEAQTRAADGASDLAELIVREARRFSAGRSGASR